MLHRVLECGRDIPLAQTLLRYSTSMLAHRLHYIVEIARVLEVDLRQLFRHRHACYE